MKFLFLAFFLIVLVFSTFFIVSFFLSSLYLPLISSSCFFFIYTFAGFSLSCISKHACLSSIHFCFNSNCFNLNASALSIFKFNSLFNNNISLFSQRCSKIYFMMFRKHLAELFKFIQLRQFKKKILTFGLLLKFYFAYIKMLCFSEILHFIYSISD